MVSLFLTLKDDDLIVIVLKSESNDLFSHRTTALTLFAFTDDSFSSVLLNSAAKIFIFIRVSPPSPLHSVIRTARPPVTPLIRYSRAS